MYQGGSDVMLGPCDSIALADEAWGIDLEAEVVVILGDVPMGATREEAAKAIKLIMLVNDVSLRNLIAPELAKGFGFVQSKAASAFTPVAVTPDELGAAFDGAKVTLPLLSFINGKPFGKPDAGDDMTFDFPTLIAHAAKTRALSAGTILGSGTVSNRDADGGPGKPIAEGGLGYSCLAELRTVETLEQRQAGDAVSEIRRPGAHRNEGRAGPFDLRRHRQDVVAYTAAADGGPSCPTRRVLLFPPLGPLYRAFAPVTEPLIAWWRACSLAIHGYPILFGDTAAVGKFLQSTGFDNGLFWAYIVGAVEFFCGLCLALGLLTRLVAVPIIGFLVVAIVTYHWQFGFHWENRGIEYPLFWSIVVFHFLVRGGGRWSLDALIGREI